jgi:hypothetical protein
MPPCRADEKNNLEVLFLPMNNFVSPSRSDLERCYADRLFCSWLSFLALIFKNKKLIEDVEDDSETISRF